MRKVLINIIRILYPIAIYFAIAAGIYLVLRILDIRTRYQDAIVILLIEQVITAAVIIWIYKIQNRQSEEKASYKLSDLGARNMILITVATFFITNTLALIVVVARLDELFPGYSEVQEYLVSSPMFFQLLATVIMAPILEEVLCRGIIFKRMREISGFWLSAAVSSLIWAVMHLNMVQGVTAFLLGFFLAYLYEKYKMLQLTILCHGFFNLIPTALAYLLTATEIEPAKSAGDSRIAFASALVVDAAITAWLLILLYHSKFPREAKPSR